MATRLGITLVSLLMVGALGAAATSAHMSRNGSWYFYGQTYKGNTVKNPVNMAFFRGRGLKTPARVGAHISDDWGDRDRGRYGTMRSGIRLCKASERMRWRDLRGNRKSDEQDLHRMTRYISCKGRQYHFRGWDDYEHSTLAAHTRGQWIVGNIHHERVRVKIKCYGPPIGCVVTGITHDIDRDWDKVRVQMIKAMATHCSYRRWRQHPGAIGTFQGEDSSGYIGRISMRHVSEGCKGA